VLVCSGAPAALAWFDDTRREKCLVALSAQCVPYMGHSFVRMSLPCLRLPVPDCPYLYPNLNSNLYGRAALHQISTISKSSLRAPHSGHAQPTGTSAHAVPGAMPSSGQPLASSYTQPQTRHIQVFDALINSFLRQFVGGLC